MSEAEDLMHAWRFGALVVEEAMYRGGTDSEASEEAEIRAGSGHSGSEEAQGVPKGEAELFVLCLDGEPYRDSWLRDGEAKGGQGEDGGGIGKAHEVGGRDRVRVGRRRGGKVRVWRRGGMKNEHSALKIKNDFLG